VHGLSRVRGLSHRRNPNSTVGRHAFTGPAPDQRIIAQTSARSVLEWALFLFHVPEVNMPELTPAMLALVVGSIISLLATYLPGFNTWWAALVAEKKQMIMALSMIIVGVVVYVLACTPSIGFPFVACPAGGVWSMLSIILSALVGNQATKLVSPDTAGVKAVKASK
jgi:drug/metabolite transporter superfamily protein YnfA